MKRIFLLLLCVICFSGCALTNNGQFAVDFVVNVDVAKDIIKASVGIGLPLALDRMDKKKLEEQAKTVSVVSSSILSLLEENEEVEIERLNDFLGMIDENMSPAERHAIQSSIELILSMVRKDLQPQRYLKPEVRHVLAFFFREVRSVYSLYSQEKVASIGTRKLSFRKNDLKEGIENDK